MNDEKDEKEEYKDTFEREMLKLNSVIKDYKLSMSRSTILTGVLWAIVDETQEEFPRPSYCVAREYVCVSWHSTKVRQSIILVVQSELYLSFYVKDRLFRFLEIKSIEEAGEVLKQVLPLIM